MYSENFFDSYVSPDTSVLVRVVLLFLLVMSPLFIACFQLCAYHHILRSNDEGKNDRIWEIIQKQEQQQNEHFCQDSTLDWM